MKKVLIIILIILVVFIIAAGIIVYNLFIKDKMNVTSVTYDPGDEFLTNLKGDSSFVKVDLIIELKDNKKIKFMEENNYKIRDSIFYVLRSKTKNDMNAEDNFEQLKKDITEKLKADLGVNEIIGVYFQEFMVQ